jgi:hypothetical protein
MTVLRESIIRAEEEITACKVLTTILLFQSSDEVFSMYVNPGMGK